MPDSSPHALIVSRRERRSGKLRGRRPGAGRRGALLVCSVIAIAAAVLTATGRDASASGTPSNPCSLITNAQIRAITHRAVVRRTLAPLGPTCIYQFRHAGEITILIERINFARAVSAMRNRTHVSVRARSAYCGQVGQPTLYVSLPAGKVLAVTAGCTTARSIARIAVGPLLG